jgi:small subunit ribosomal protein S21
MTKHFKDAPPIASVSVTIKEHERFESALRRFKRKVADSGKLQDLREKEFFEQPSQTRKKAKAAGRARAQKRLKESLPKKTR